MKNKTKAILYILILIVIGGDIYAYIKSNSSEVNNTQKEIKLPRFSDYPTKPLTTSSIPLINLASHPTGAQFKTRISEANKTAPNFAGKYSIVTWGCGTNCGAGVIIDRSTGNIISSLPFVMENGFETKVDSSLIIINPYTPDIEQQPYPVITYYAKWNGHSFDLIGSYIITKDSIKLSTSTSPAQF